MHMLTHTGEKPFLCKLCTSFLFLVIKFIMLPLLLDIYLSFNIFISTNSFIVTQKYINIVKTHKLAYSGEIPSPCSICDNLVFYYNIFILRKFYIWNVIRQTLLYFSIIFIIITSGENLVKCLFCSKTKMLSLCDLCVICELDIIVLVYNCLSCIIEPKTISLR